MRIKSAVAVILVGVVTACQPVWAASTEVHSGGAMTKLGRGFVNLVTGWVEIPKRIHETSESQGTAAGITWGLLRGLGHGFIRTAAGAYEILTFPFPAPPDYASVIQPEYVFSDKPVS